MNSDDDVLNLRGVYPDRYGHVGDHHRQHYPNCCQYHQGWDEALDAVYERLEDLALNDNVRYILELRARTTPVLFTNRTDDNEAS